MSQQRPGTAKLINKCQRQTNKMPVLLSLGLPVRNWPLSSASARMKSLAPSVADLPCPLKGVQGGGEHFSHPHSGKTGRTGLQIVRYFLEKFFFFLNMLGTGLGYLVSFFFFLTFVLLTIHLIVFY